MEEKNLLALAVLILIILISGCIDVSSVFKQVIFLDIIKAGNASQEEVSINAEIPSFVREEQEFSWKIGVNPINDIKKLNLIVYQQCMDLTGENKWEENFDIKKDRSKQFEAKNTVNSNIEFKRDCDIRFKANYTSNFTATRTVAVLDEAEYEQRHSDGTLGEIEIHETNSENPLKIRISFSEADPFIDGGNVLMYVDYSVKGSGNLIKIESVEIKYPKNLELSKDGCDDYQDNENNVLELKQELSIHENKIKRSTCIFDKETNNIIDLGNLEINAEYTYEIFGELSIEINK